MLTGVGITDAGTKAEINGGLQVWNLFYAVTAALLVDKLGRRTLFIISNTGMLISTLSSILFVSLCTDSHPFQAFCMWNLTNALFQTKDNTNAAKGQRISAVDQTYCTDVIP